MYRAPFIILYYDQQMHNYFTNYHSVIICEIIVHVLVIAQNKKKTRMLLSRECYMFRPAQIILSDYVAIIIIIIINHYYY
jgi:hypothetical protein